MEELENAAGYDLAREAAAVQIVQGKNKDHHTEQDEESESTTKVDDIDCSEVPKEVRGYFSPHPENYEDNLYSSLSFSAYL